MRENKAAEKLSVLVILKENAAMIIAIGGFIWVIYSSVILPIKNLEYQVGDILNNHLKTIQNEQVKATAERAAEADQINKANEKLVKLETILEQVLDKKTLE